MEDKIQSFIKKEIAECWKAYKKVGMKKKGNKMVPNCVPKNEVSSWDGSASKNPGMWDGKPSEKNTGKPFPSVGENVYYVDAVNEHEEYCPVCADRIKESIKKAVNELMEKKGKCKPSKGKRFAKRVSGKCRSFGQKGKAKKGGDRIRPGTAKGNAYCARSAKIKKCKNPPCANALSRKKWKCQGSRSVA